MFSKMLITKEYPAFQIASIDVIISLVESTWHIFVQCIKCILTCEWLVERVTVERMPSHGMQKKASDFVVGKCSVPCGTAADVWDVPMLGDPYTLY